MTVQTEIPGREAVTVQQRVVDAHWSLRMALAWITYRSEQDVVDITHGRGAPTKAAIRDLLSALRSGKYASWEDYSEGVRIKEDLPEIKRYQNACRLLFANVGLDFDYTASKRGRQSALPR
jgi:hypothetical protein